MNETTKAVHPLDLSEFKNLGPTTPTTIIDIPEKIENRVPTDRWCLIIFVGCVIFLMPLLTYNLSYSDIRKIGKIDDCGNICGDTNIKYEQWNCTGQNFTDKKITQIVIREIKKGDTEKMTECVEECKTGYSEIGWFCISDKNHVGHLQVENTEYLSRETVICRLILSFLISVGVSVGVVYLFRCSVAVMVWAIIVCLFILCSIVVGSAWALYIFVKDIRILVVFISDIHTYILIVCSLGTSFLLIYAAAVYFLRNKIKLFILLLKETTTAIHAVPSLIIVPIFTSLANVIIVILFLTTNFYMSTCGELTEKFPGKLYYEMTPLQSLVLLFNFIITIWALYFVNGLQYMIIGGVISEWYFAKNKTNLVQPLKNMAIVICKCHLGTIAFGSAILITAQGILFFLKSILKRVCGSGCMSCWIACAEFVLEFVTKRAYIVTAMHGQPFYKSGKRAAKLIIENVCNVSTIMVIETFIFGLTVLLIAVVSVLLSVCLFLSDIEDYWKHFLVFIIQFILALFVGVSFLVLFKTTTNTIFMCFCEDTIINDGMTRPYAMSTDLMEFIEISKKPIGIQRFASRDPPILDTKI